MYRYVFFDLDGTVTDSGTAITNSVRYALKKFGIDDPDPAVLRRFIGPPLVDSFMQFYGMSKENALLATSYYREFYPAGEMFNVTIYDGIVELLGDLRERGRVVVLATSKPEVYAKAIIERIGLKECFDMIAGATMDESRNKKHQVIAYALKSLGVADARDAVMIGDTAFDVTGARENGMDCIGVSFGFGTVEELREAGAIAVVDRAEEILEIV
ncbi:MAG: HAD hydrolase-like protein [Lachnospiraceae bacterium]|nr:HAD hydrolase-like protein [Lachnospiraceae bacterium]